MRRLLLVFPVLAHVLFAAHLLFHGLPIYIAALALVAAALVFFKSSLALRSTQILLAAYGIEWARAGWVLVEMRLTHDMSIMPAAPIMAGVTLFTFACIRLAAFAIDRRKPAAQTP
ncbi:MAG: hypothetical protein ACI4SV_05245 [Duodenibacillus sp.]